MKRAIVVALAATFACAPTFLDEDDLVTSPRILAVRADPAEAKPGATVTFTALVAAPQGPVTSPDIDWSFCVAPRPLTTDNVVSNACLGAQATDSIGEGGSVTAATPANGCSLFGPDPPTAGLRPVDPDATGGYFQPLREDLAGADATFSLARITCDLPGASAAAATAFAAAYRPNENPTLLPLTASIDGAAADLTAIPAGARVDLEASWPATSAETYAYYDPASDTVTSKREAMTVAWYVTAGVLDVVSTGRSESDPGTTSDDGYVAPAGAGVAHLWIVLRDSRGGVDFAAYDLDVVAHP